MIGASGNKPVEGCRLVVWNTTLRTCPDIADMLVYTEDGTTAYTAGMASRICILTSALGVAGAASRLLSPSPHGTQSSYGGFFAPFPLPAKIITKATCRHGAKPAHASSLSGLENNKNPLTRETGTHTPNTRPAGADCLFAATFCCCLLCPLFLGQGS